MITFANGTSIDTIAVYGGKMEHQNARRNFLNIVCAADMLTLDEAKALYIDSAATSEITVQTGGEISVHLDFSIPVELKLTEQDGVEVICIKLAQKSALELAQEAQAADIEAVTAAIIEIGEMLGGE